MKTLICIVGPTASGKTDAAIYLAKKFNTAILSADSRQFYRQMDIGTAKPSLQQRAEAIHYFIDDREVTQFLSAGNYEQEALNCLQKQFLQTDVALAVGGSGLYIQALTDGLDEMPQTNLVLRNQLNQEVADGNIEGLRERLKALDPDYYQIVDRNNPQRIVRALEVCLETGKSYSYFRNQQSKARNFNIIYIGLDVLRSELYRRIDRRVDAMVQNGLFEEVSALTTYKDLYPLRTVGYKEVFAYLEGLLSKEEAITLIKKNTRNYAKRQLTWFRRNEKTQWMHPDKPELMYNFVEQQLQTTRGI